MRGRGGVTQRLSLTTAHMASVEVGQGRRRRDSERTDDIFAFDIWRMESRIVRDRKGVQKGGECTACYLAVNVFTIVCRVYYIYV